MTISVTQQSIYKPADRWFTIRVKLPGQNPTRGLTAFFAVLPLKTFFDTLPKKPALSTIGGWLVPMPWLRMHRNAHAYVHRLAGVAERSLSNSSAI